VKALRAVQHLTPEEISRFVVRGQYGDGKIRGKKVKAYRDEPDIKPDSQTETFVALKLAINNWRWAGVPFYLRTGKRLHKRATEIVLHFKQPPFPIFGHVAAKGVTTNFLTIRIQPEEGISLRVNAKVPGITVEIQPVAMDFSYADTFRKKSVSAYERLLHDCLLGDATLFARRDGIETAWSIVTPILETWEEEKKPGKIPIYEAGSWGPKEADELIQKDEREWGG
jgi:glucose-6-phosphate 1-dehydrogenase